jgi:transcriptional regulator with XRE-family HTH domain
MGQDDSAAAHRAINMRLREELALRRLSRTGLADRAKVSLSSLEKCLAGQRPFTDQTLTRIEAVLNITLRKPDAETPAIAPEHLGSYSRAAVSWIEGSYLTLRPSVSQPGSIYAYETLIGWEAPASHLVFREVGRTDTAYAQQGSVSIPHQSGHIYLVTNKHGQHRVAMLSRQGITGELYGLLLTLQTGRGAQLLPVAMPMVLVPMATAQGLRGTLDASHPDYAALKHRLDKTLADGFALLLPSAGARL